MANWFAYQQHNKQIKARKHRRVSDVLGSLVLIIVGVWLNIHFLNYYDIHPLGKEPLAWGTETTTFFQPGVIHWEKKILSWADTYDLDPLLIATVMQIESCGDPHAVSPAGAQGLFQVMPYHFQPEEDMLDPQTNAARGLTYLHKALNKSNGDIQLAMAGYNGGHTQIDRHPDRWPEETKRYVAWGWGIYQDAKLGMTTGQTLSAWLDAGGQHLCRQAEISLGLH